MRRKPIGQILVEKGDITEEHLTAALEEQDRSGRRLGEILIEQGHTSWLALARALAEQVLDIKAPVAEEPEPVAEPKPDAVELVREMAERFASLPPVPDPLPPPEPVALAPPAPQEDPEHELARELAEQVANLNSPVATAERTLLHLTPTPRVEASPLDTDTRLHTIEALLKERQRAFMELFTTAETLRMKVARLEEIIEERDRELAKLRIARAS